MFMIAWNYSREVFSVDQFEAHFLISSLTLYFLVILLSLIVNLDKSFFSLLKKEYLFHVIEILGILKFCIAISG